MTRISRLTLLVVAKVLLLGLSGRAWADTTVVFEYPFDDSVLVTVHDSATGTSVAGVMLGIDRETVEVPISPGSFTLRINRVEDFAIAITRQIEVEEGEDVRVELDRVPLSGRYQLEKKRDEFIRAAAVESTLAFGRQRTGRLRTISLGTGLVAGAGAAGAYWYGQGLYANYQSAKTTSEASSTRSAVELMSGVVVGLGAGAAVSLLTGLIAQIAMPSIEEARADRLEHQRALEAAEEERATWPDYADEAVVGAQGGGE